MNNPPLISIVVPCYNQVQYLFEALDSVVAQSYGNWECIIVNDGSTDSTEEISTSYCSKDDRFKYLKKDNGGLSSARNAGVSIARGEFILPLDADDKISSYYLQRAMEKMKENPQIKLIYCKAERFGLMKGEWFLEEYSYRRLLIKNMIFCSSIFRKSDFDKISGYDELMVGGYEDWEFLLRFLNPDDIVHRLNETHFFYRIKKASAIHNDHRNERDKKLYIYQKHISKYLDYFSDPVSLALENEMLKDVYKNSFDYKLGHIVMDPLRRLKNLIQSL